MKHTRHVVAALALSVTMLSLAGCGSKSANAPLTPILDTTPPSAPANVHGTYDALASRDYVNWDLSASSDVATYEVWQYAADPATGTAGVRIGTVGSGVNSLMLPVQPSSGTSFFRIRAIDTSLNMSAFSSTAPLALHGDTDNGGGGGGRKDPSIY